MKRWCLVCVLALVACIGAGCSPGGGTADGVGDVSLQANVRTVPSAPEQLDKVVVVLTSGATTVSAEAPVVGTSATPQLTDSRPDRGTSRQGLLHRGYATYTGTGNVVVKRDASTSTELVLKPLDGSVRLEVDACELPGAEQAATVDIMVYYAGGTSAYRSYTGLPLDSSPLVAEDTGYIPRSYDMKIVLKASDGTAVYERLQSSDCEPAG